MKLEQSFEVAAPLARVWDALIDVERVAPCLPGAAVTGRNDDGSYNGTFKVKIGPTSAAYTGKLQMENIDESGHKATMQAAGTDKRGQGGAKATIVSSVTETGQGSTRVEVVTEYHITGRLARFGRGGMIEEISNRLLNEFAKSLQGMVAGGTEPGSPASGVEEPAAAAPAPPRDEAEGATAAAPTPPSSTAPPSSSSPPASQPATGESEPVEGLSLMASVLWSQAKRNPAPVAALVFSFLLALRLLGRRG